MASMPGTVEDTVDEIVDEGGQAIGVRCDHGDPAQVAGLIEMIAATYGRLDVLVNNAWGGHEGFAPDAMGAPLWDQPLEQWDAMMTNGVRNHLVTLQHAAPLMCTRGGRLIAAITFCDEGRYLSGNVFYDLAKHVINRIAFAAATELRDDAIASVAVSPGFMRTELVLAHLHTTEATFRERSELASSETPHYLGRAVVALADDPDVFDQTGRVLTVAELARRYGFTDLDGTQPAAFQVAAVGDGPAGNR
jgi:NAD(P)-dependent dehydrogenase (short-subunit alcohol dehydrogenase family)